MSKKISLKSDGEQLNESDVVEKNEVDEGALAVESEIKKIEAQTRREVSQNMSTGKLPDNAGVTTDQLIKDIGLRATKTRNVAIQLIKASQDVNVMDVRKYGNEVIAWSESIKEVLKNI